MVRDSDRSGGTLGTEKVAGLMTGLFAEENEFDRRALWRIGSWGAGAVAAVTLAVVANQTSLGWRREQVAAADLARQAQQIQSVAKESQNETRRLASAIDTLSGDRDRLYSRVTVLEQGLDSVTGAIARQNSVPVAAKAPATGTSGNASPGTASPGTAAVASPSAPSPMGPPAASAAPVTDAQAAPRAQPPSIAPVATTAPAMLEKPRPPEGPARPEQVAVLPPQALPSPPIPPQSPQPSMAIPSMAMATPAANPAMPAPLVAAKSMMGPPDPAASRLIEPAKSANASAPAPAPAATAMAGPATTAPDPAASEAAAKDTGKDTAKDTARDSVKDMDAAKPAVAEASVQRTEFAVDLGSANSLGGLRALWRGLLKSNAELAELRPIVMVREGNTGLGMQLRLAAGPLKDAATAAKICAALIENERACGTTVFDGQRLAVKSEEAQGPPPASKPPAEAKPAPTYYRHGGSAKHVKKEEPPTPPKQESSSFSSLFGISRR